MIHDMQVVHCGDILMHYYGDDYTSHYVLSGARFNHQHALLDLIAKYDDACTEDGRTYALVSEPPCDLNCQQCPKSIYRIVEEQEKTFNQKCADLCQYHPHAGDEWEISTVSEFTAPKYQEFFFRAINDVDYSIIDLAYIYTKNYEPDFLTTSKYCYVKIRLLNMPKAYDVSTFANKRIHEIANQSTL